MLELQCVDLQGWSKITQKSGQTRAWMQTDIHVYHWPLRNLSVVFLQNCRIMPPPTERCFCFVLFSQFFTCGPGKNVCWFVFFYPACPLVWPSGNPQPALAVHWPSNGSSRSSWQVLISLTLMALVFSLDISEVVEAFLRLFFLILLTFLTDACWGTLVVEQ